MPTKTSREYRAQWGRRIYIGGALLDCLIENYRWKQIDIAAHLGVTQPCISRWWYGDSAMRVPVLTELIRMVIKESRLEIPWGAAETRRWLNKRLGEGEDGEDAAVS